MSRLSPDFIPTFLHGTLVLALYPDRIVWLQLTAGWKQSVASKGQINCLPDVAQPWRNAVNLLPALLNELQAKGKSIKLIISNRLLRYAITPNPDSARNPHELELMVRHVFQKAYGAVVDAWDIRVSESAVGKPGLACAMDKEMLNVLNTVISSAGARLVSVLPYLMAAFNQYQKKQNREGIFVLAEPERLCFLTWQDSGWMFVHQGHLLEQANDPKDWFASLGNRLERLSLSGSLPSVQQLTVCAPELAAESTADQSRNNHSWQIEQAMPRWPNGVSPHMDQAYAGALLALV